MANWFVEHQDLWIGAVIGVVATILIGYFFWRLAEKPKKLGYDRIAIRTLLDPSFRPESSLKLFLNGQEVLNPHLLTMRIINYGRSTIEIDDLAESAIKMNLIMTSRIQQVSVSGSSPESLASDVEVNLFEHNASDIVFKFLNPREWFELQFVTFGRPEEPTLEARIKGSKEGLVHLDKRDPELGELSPFRVWLLAILTRPWAVPVLGLVLILLPIVLVVLIRS